MFSDIYKNRKVLITGATGFKGSWLALWLKRLGADVVGYSLPPKTKMDNFVTCKVESQIYHKYADVRDLEKLNAFVQETKPEIIFHLAAQPIVLQSYVDPVENFETNVMGTVNILEAIRKSDSVKAFINVTTDKVYKNTEKIWGYREDDAIAGNDPYSASKSCSEIVTASYQYAFLNDKKINIATARAGNVIGGGDWAADRIVPDFFRAVQSGEAMTIRNPNATRPWQHVLESLSGYLTLGASLFQSAEYSGGWNFGPQQADKSYPVFELIDELLSHYPQVVVKEPDGIQRQREAHLLQLDITKARHFLNWSPMLDFKKTIQFTEVGYRADLQNENCLNNRNEQIETFMNLMQDKMSFAH